MKSTIKFLHRLLATTTLTIIFSSAQSQSTNDNFKPLYSLAGNWVLETKNGMLYENWHKIDDSTLKSKNYKLNAGDTVLLEHAEIIQRGDSITYIATVSDQNNNRPVAFVLSKQENNTYIFENAQHDFPQRIIYVLPEQNKLHAWIEGNINGQFKRSDYHFTKLE